MPQYNLASGTDCTKIPAKEIVAGINVYRFKIPPFARNIPLIRGLEHFILSIILFCGALFNIKDYDVILVYSPPLPLGITGYLLAKVKGKKVIVNIQDLYPQTVIDLGLLTNKFLIRVSKWMESFIYRKSDYITVHSEGNLGHVLANGAKKGMASVVHNWVDVEKIQPGSKINRFSEKYKIQNKFVISFAGVMGFAQDLGSVLDVATNLKYYENIIFILVGNGSNKDDLIKKKESLNLNNVLFIDTQPLDEYPYVLHSSDICLVTLSKDLLTPVVPGKLLSIMASGRPVVASIPLSGDTPKIISKYECGIAVQAGDLDSLASEILRLYNDKDLRESMGKKGREASVAVFAKEACVAEYEKIIEILNRRANVK